jgi:methyl-accepting chemotaxis protein
VVRSLITRNIESDSSGRISRRDLQETIGTILSEQQHLSSIYAQFEPDGYDGMDIYFTDGVDEHSSDDGTLEVYYYRDPQGNVTFSRTEDPSSKYLENRNEFGVREAEWYLCSRDSLKPCLMEPYEYEIEEGYSELMTSLVVPIQNNGEFAGVSGVDINLSTLQATIAGVSQALFDGESRVSLLSEGGLIAASSHYQSHLGRPLQEAVPDLADEFVRLHQRGGRFDDGQTLAVAYPVDVQLPGAEWSLLIELPRSVALAGGFNAFLARLREMINDLKEVNAQVRGQAADVGAIARDTDDQTSRQHQDIDSVVTAMNEMSAAAGEVAGFAGEAADNARAARDGIRFTQDTLGAALKGVDALAGDMEQASSAIGHVAQRSEEINRILEVIRGIAEQTNLLALNAAIEAARAGEQGRGFAVVADEVRTLASKTRESTDEISDMIERLKGDVDGAVTVIQGGVERATTAVDGTREADHSLATVVERIGTIVEHVTQVATAAEEQSSVSEEINRNLTQIGDAANDLRELAQRVRQSGEALDGQVQVLDRELGRLKT